MIQLPSTVYLLAGAFLAGAVATYKVMDWKHDAELKHELEVAVDLARTSGKVVTRTETVVQERIRVVKEKGETIVRYIPKVITERVEAACPGGLPHGFVRLHDDAAANRAPGPPTVADADPAGTPLAEAAEAVTDNYTAYHACRAQVEGWKAYYESLRKLFGEAR